MNVVTANIAGSKDKLLIVRDVSHLIYLKQVLETKKSMYTLTDNIIKDVELQVNQISKTINNLDRYVYQEGKYLVDEAFYDIQKIKFKVKGIEYVNNIIENKFQVKNDEFNV